MEHAAADGHGLCAGPVRRLPLIHQPMGVLAIPSAAFKATKRYKELLGAEELHRGLVTPLKAAFVFNASVPAARAVELATSTPLSSLQKPSWVNRRTRPGVQRSSRAPPQVECLGFTTRAAKSSYFNLFHPISIYFQAFPAPSLASHISLLRLPRPSTTRQSLASSSWIDSCHDVHSLAILKSLSSSAGLKGRFLRHGHVIDMSSTCHRLSGLLIRTSRRPDGELGADHGSTSPGSRFSLSSAQLVI